MTEIVITGKSRRVLVDELGLTGKESEFLSLLASASVPDAEKFSDADVQKIKSAYLRGATPKAAKVPVGEPAPQPLTGGTTMDLENLLQQRLDTERLQLKEVLDRYEAGRRELIRDFTEEVVTIDLSQTEYFLEAYSTTVSDMRQLPPGEWEEAE